MPRPMALRAEFQPSGSASRSASRAARLNRAFRIRRIAASRSVVLDIGKGEAERGDARDELCQENALLRARHVHELEACRVFERLIEGAGCLQGRAPFGDTPSVRLS